MAFSKKSFLVERGAKVQSMLFDERIQYISTFMAAAMFFCVHNTTKRFARKLKNELKMF